MDRSHANKSLEHISLLNNKKENNENGHKTCCATTFKYYYKIRRVKNKGALIVLLHCLLVTSIGHIFYNLDGIQYPTSYQYMWLIPGTVGASLAGWIADAFVGRYRMIKGSTWLIWLLITISTLEAVVAQFVNADHKLFIMNKLLPVTISAIGFGLGGFHANIVQFGLDQLQDASTTEITTFIVWYGGTIFSSGIVVNLLALLNKYKILSLLFLFFMCLFPTMAVLLLMCCNHLLIKEPPSKNPFKLIYNVVRFAIKNKHPRCRSAFTYHEDDLPFRIDFGKSKYGGPFTTEQVEDVKTFFRMFPLILIFGMLGGSVVAANILYNSLIELQYDKYHPIEVDHSDHTVAAEFSVFIIYFGVTLLLVLNELFIYPVFHRCLVRVLKTRSLSRVMIGILLHLTGLTILLVLDVMSRHAYLNNNGYNSTLQCDFYEKRGILHGTVGKHWFYYPAFLETMSMLFYFIGIVEFLSSQSPYAMRGLIFGILYFILPLFSVPVVVLAILVPNKHFSIWSTKTISCGFWFILVTIILCLVVSFLFMYLMKWYKLRKREDVLPNEHIFAERYYEKLET